VINISTVPTSNLFSFQCIHLLSTTDNCGTGVASTSVLGFNGIPLMEPGSLGHDIESVGYWGPLSGCPRSMDVISPAFPGRSIKDPGNHLGGYKHIPSSPPYSFFLFRSSIHVEPVEQWLKSFPACSSWLPQPLIVSLHLLTVTTADERLFFSFTHVGGGLV
jgi:hypothetical protein